MFSLLYILLTHTFLHYECIHRSLPVSFALVSLLSHTLSLSSRCCYKLFVALFVALSRCAFAQVFAAAVSCCQLAFAFLLLLLHIRSIGIGNLAAANKMFICYLPKTILNKIQTMYSHSLTHSTILFPYNFTLSCPLSLTFALSSRLLCHLLIAGILPRRCNWNVSSCLLLLVLLLVLLLLLVLVLWVAVPYLLVGSCFVVLCLWNMTPPVCVCVCFCVPFSHWLSLTNRVGYLPAPTTVTLYCCYCCSFCCCCCCCVVTAASDAALNCIRSWALCGCGRLLCNH